MKIACKATWYYIACLLPMERFEFPSTAINSVAKSDASQVEHSGFIQPTFDGLETEQPPEIEPGNCIVTAAFGLEN
jgi:hypothetical protein